MWGTSVWGRGAVWGGTSQTYTKSEWVSVEGIGHSISWQLQLTIGNTVDPEIELVSISLVYETGDAVA